MPTVEQLKAHAKNLGLSGYSKLKKAQLEKLVSHRKIPSRVPQYTAPVARGRSSSPHRVPQYTAPVRGRTVHSLLPQYTAPVARGRSSSPARPAPPSLESQAKHRFIQMSIANGVPKKQAEYNWLLSQTDDDDDLIEFDFRRRR